jgi:hypothetical protein
MAYDLILGQTARDWSSSGSFIRFPTPNPGLEDASSMDPSDMAESTRHEIARTTNLAVRLSKAKRLPPADYDAYRKFHSFWIDYSGHHSGRWAPRDNLNLWNIRQINKQFDGRFAIFDAVAKAPIKKPGLATPGTSLATIAPPARHPVAVLLGVGLAIGALAWLGGQKKYRPV